MVKDIYLSIDLDFWKDEGQREYEELFFYLGNLFEKNIPIICVEYHHQMLPFVNRKKNLKELINIDFHSDFTDMTMKELEEDNLFNEGTWINFVNFRKRGTFTWIYPNRSCYFDRYKGIDGECRGWGRCDIKKNPFDYRNTKKITEWNKAKLRKTFPTKNEINRIAEIGICISPNWITEVMLKDSLSFLLENNIIDYKFYKKLSKK